jgi:hypothetical protein
VVPHRCGVVEYTADRGADQLLETPVGFRLATHALIQLVEIARVVLPVVQPDGLGVDLRRERGLGIGQ